MKKTNHYLLVLMLFFSIKGSAADTDIAPVQAVPANDFLRTIGVNTSINTRGETFTKTKECAQYLGFRYIRAGASDYMYQFKDLFENCHVRFSIGLGSENGIDRAINFAQRLVEQVSPDALIAFEGCNEPNNWPITYNGQKQTGDDYAPLGRYQRDFYAAVKANDVLKDYPVWSFTDAGGSQPHNLGLQFLTVPANFTGESSEFAGVTFADVACVHNYFSGLTARTNNQTWLAADRIHANSLKSNFGETWYKKFQGYTDAELMNLRCVTTETGSTIDGYNVTEEYQAQTYLTCYLAQFKQGFEYTAMYIMRDRTDEGGNQTFGFYDGSYTPRLAAHYLHNFTSVLHDTLSIEQPGTLSYEIVRRDDSPNEDLSTVHDLLLQKENGTFMLVIWGERFQRGSKADLLDVRFAQTFDKINVYNPMQYDAANPSGGVAPVATYTNVNSIPLEVLKSTFILEFNPIETNIKPVSENKMNVYPAFVEDCLHISPAAAVKQYEIFDLAGKKLLTGGKTSALSVDVNVTSLPKGGYIVKTTQTNNLVDVHKFFKQ